MSSALLQVSARLLAIYEFYSNPFSRSYFMARLFFALCVTVVLILTKLGARTLVNSST